MAKALEWTKRVAAWRASGLSAERFCSGQGYSAKSLWHWSSKLGRTSVVAAAPKRRGAVQFARVARSALSALSAEHSSILVELAGARLTLRGSVDAAALRAVVAVLRDATEESSR